MTATASDEKVAAYLDDCGPAHRHEGYGFFWMLLETVAVQIESGSNKCSATYTLPTWSRLLYCHHHTVGKYLGKLEVTGMVTVRKDGGKIEVTIPNLLKYRDEYSKKSGQDPESVRSKNRDRDRERTDTEQRSDAAPTTVPDRFAEFIEPWPRVAKPDQAARMWISVIDTPADEAAAFAARDRYLASDEVSRGIVGDPARWLQDQKSANWGGKWPTAIARPQNGSASTVDRALATMIDRASKGERPA